MLHWKTARFFANYVFRSTHIFCYKPGNSVFMSESLQHLCLYQKTFLFFFFWENSSRAICGLFQCCVWPVSVLYAACVRATCGLFQCCMWPVSVLYAACVRATCGAAHGLFECCEWPVLMLYVACFIVVWPVSVLWVSVLVLYMALFSVFCGLFQCFVWPVSVLCVACFSVVCGLFQCCVWPVSVFCVACFSVVCGLFQCCVWPVSVLCVACFSDVCGLFQWCVQPVSGLYVACFSVHWRICQSWWSCTWQAILWHWRMGSVLPITPTSRSSFQHWKLWMGWDHVLRPMFRQLVSVLRPAFVQSVLRPAFIEVIVLSQSMYSDLHSVSHCTDLCWQVGCVW